MNTNTFDTELQRLTSEMVEISFEFVNRNTDEVDRIFIYGSMEGYSLFFKVFYQINGQLVGMHKVNDLLEKPCDTSRDRMFKLLGLGNDYLKEIDELFKSDDREVPTYMKMIYEPKSGAFDNEIRYENQYHHLADKSVADCYTEWYEEIRTLI